MSNNKNAHGSFLILVPPTEFRATQLLSQHPTNATEKIHMATHSCCADEQNSNRHPSILGNDFPRVAFQIQFCDRESGRGGILGWTRSLFQHVFLAPLRDSVSRPLKIAFSILEIALLQLLLHTCSNLSLSKEFRAQKREGETKTRSRNKCSSKENYAS